MALTSETKSASSPDLLASILRENRPGSFRQCVLGQMGKPLAQVPEATLRALIREKWLAEGDLPLVETLVSATWQQCTQEVWPARLALILERLGFKWREHGRFDDDPALKAAIDVAAGLVI